MWRLIDAELRAGFEGEAAVRGRLAEVQQAVALGEMTPATAAGELLLLAGRRTT
jgi:hypothetical protein